MKRLYLTVEGQTEAAFAVEVLRPHLAAYEVMLHAPRFTGPHARRRGRIPQGGLLRSFTHAPRDIRNWLHEDRSPDARFSMMVDLYSLPPDFPGYAEAMNQGSGREQASALEAALGTELGDRRFVPYLQVHEFEALVLAEPQRLSLLYEIPSAKLDALCHECGRYATPEDIDQGIYSHPKARIKRCVPQYDENIAGPLLASEIGLKVLRERCPHFGHWLTLLERLNRP